MKLSKGLKIFIAIFLIAGIFTGYVMYQEHLYEQEHERKKLNEELISTIKKCKKVKIFELIEKGADINYKDKNNATPIMWATLYCDLDVVKKLIKLGADYNTNGVIWVSERDKDYYGNLLSICVVNSKNDILRYFIEELKIDPDLKEYNPYDQERNGWTALMYASYMGNYDLVEYLIDKGADINYYHYDENFTPLVLALLNTSKTNFSNRKNNVVSFICGDTRKTAMLLIDKGANVNISGKNENLTSLMLAAYQFDTLMCYKLIQKGADIKAVTKKGESVLDFAKKNKDTLVYYYIDSLLKK